MREPQRKHPLAYSLWPHLKLRGPFRNKRQKKALSQHPSGTARPPETKPDSWRLASSVERTKIILDSWVHSTQTTPHRYPFRCSQASPTDVQGELHAQHANDTGGTVQGQAHGTLERHGKASEAATLGCSSYLMSNRTGVSCSLALLFSRGRNAPLHPLVKGSRSQSHPGEPAFLPGSCWRCTGRGDSFSQ